MAVPARKAKPGAQKWVSHRVRKAPVSAEKPGTPEYTLTWSSAINTMAAPRRISMDRILELEIVMPLS